MNSSTADLRSTTALRATLKTEPWFKESVPLANVPAGMLGSRESLLCFFLARDVFFGSGTIVDAGSFLGKSAFHLAHGLRASACYRPGEHVIHCFDNFLVNEDGTIGFLRAELSQNLRIGDSTRRFFEAQTAPVAETLRIHAGDFHVATWTGEPIEILLVDIAKSAGLLQQAVRIFFPALIPDQSLIIHQDYHHPWLPHIHVTMEYLSDYFELIVPRVDDSAVFRLRSAIPSNVLQRVIDYDFTFEEQLQLMDRAIARLAREHRHYIELARVVLQFGKSSERVLRPEIHRIRKEFQQDAGTYAGDRYFDEVESSLDEWAGWECLRERAFERCLELSDRIVAKRPTRANMTMRGSAFRALRRFQEAEQQFRQALAAGPCPGYPEGATRIELALVLWQQGRRCEAERELLDAVRETPLSLPSRQYLDLLAQLWSESVECENRNKIVADLCRDVPGDPEVNVLEARLRRYSGDSVGADECLNRAIRLGLPGERINELRGAL